MIPVLYESSETAFTSNGIGRLNDIISCTVTEERNGKFECEFAYPIDGELYDEITLGRFIYCSTSRGKKQPFEIYDSTKPLNGKVTFRARHISYRLSLIPVSPFTASSAATALSGLKSNSMETNPFTFWTNVSTAATYKQTIPASVRSRLGGVEGSVLDQFGGEYEWDMWTVKLWTQRGSNKGVSIRYGKNLTSLSQEESIENTITGIVPYFTDTEGNSVVGDLITTASAANFPYPRTICVDVSSNFQNTTPTKAQVNAAGQSYINTHSIGVPSVSLKVSFVNLADTEEYKDVAALETVYLCDTVNVYFEKLGVNATAKVITTEWDALLDKYNSIELGSARASLSSTIVAQEKALQSYSTTSVMQQAINNATSLITGNKGGYVVIHEDELTGEPYEILIMDTNDINTATNVWRWNQSGWGYSSSGYAGPYTLAATIDGAIVADFITTGTLTGLEINNGNGTFYVDSSGNATMSSVNITSANTSARVDINNGAVTTFDINGYRGVNIAGQKVRFYSYDSYNELIGSIIVGTNDSTGVYESAMVSEKSGSRAGIGAMLSSSSYELAVWAEYGSGYAFISSALIFKSEDCGFITRGASNNDIHIVTDANHSGHLSYGSLSSFTDRLKWNSSGGALFGTWTGTISSSSDGRYKTDIEDIDEELLDEIEKIDLKQFHFNLEDMDKRLGVGAIAQDCISDVLDKYNIVNKGEYHDIKGMYSINYTNFLIARLAAAERRIKTLEDKLNKEG